MSRENRRRELAGGWFTWRFGPTQITAKLAGCPLTLRDYICPVKRPGGLHHNPQNCKVTLTSAWLCYTPVPRCSQNKWTFPPGRRNPRQSELGLLSLGHQPHIYFLEGAVKLALWNKNPPSPKSRPSAVVSDASNHFNPFLRSQNTRLTLMAAAEGEGGESNRSWVENTLQGRAEGSVPYSQRQDQDLPPESAN